MTKRKPDARPAARDKFVTVPMTQADYDAAVRKAGSPGRLRSIMRILLGRWIDGDIPPDAEPTEDELEFDSRRAQKRPRQ